MANCSYASIAMDPVQFLAFTYTARTATAFNSKVIG